VLNLTGVVCRIYSYLRRRTLDMKVPTPPSQVDLDPRLEAVLARLCERRGILFKTQAVKLPYLVDVVAQAALGRRITSGTHQTWDYGVVTREVFDFITGDGRGIFKFMPHAYSEGGRTVRLVGKPPRCLSSDELAVVDYVAERWGSLTPSALGLLTKNMNSEVPADAWGKNRQAKVDQNAFGRLSEGWQAFCEAAPSLDLQDHSKWSPAVLEDDLAEHFRQDLGA